MEVMGSMATIDFESEGRRRRPRRAWRTRDIVVTAIIGVTFGVVIWIWNGLLGRRSTLLLPSRRRRKTCCTPSG